jgi:hypothetical protein
LDELLETARGGLGARSRLAELIRESSNADLVALLGEPGRCEVLLDAVFEQMARSVGANDIARYNAVVHWHVPVVLGDEIDSFQLSIGGGRAKLSRDLAPDPMTAIEISPVDLLRVTVGQTTMIHLIFEGRVSVDGDVLLATQFGEIFG